jgi:hypothetical protein
MYICPITTITSLLSERQEWFLGEFFNDFGWFRYYLHLRFPHRDTHPTDQHRSTGPGQNHSV